MTDLADLSAAALSRAFRAKRLSPVEVTRAVLARIEASEPAINAMYIVSAESALKARRPPSAAGPRASRSPASTACR